MSIPRLLLLITALVFFAGFSTADRERNLVIKAPFNDFSVDNLGNVYLVNQELLIKYNPAGKELARYSNLKLGAITYADVTNPLKPVLYYRDFQQVVFLDNQLSPQHTPLSLEAVGMEQAQLVCASANNSIWVYNRQNSELVRYNEDGKKISATGNLKQILQRELEPVFMVEHNNLLYLCCKSSGVLIFDIFGTFSKAVPLRDLNRLQVNGPLLYFERNKQLCSYETTTFEESCLDFSADSKLVGLRFYSPLVYLDYKDSLVAVRP